MPLAILSAIGNVTARALKGVGILAKRGAIEGGKLALRGVRKAGSLALRGAKRLGKSAARRVGRGLIRSIKKRAIRPSEEETISERDKSKSIKKPKSVKVDNSCKIINECIASLAKSITPLQVNTQNLNSAFQSATKSTGKLSKAKQFLGINLKSLLVSLASILNPIKLLHNAIKLLYNAVKVAIKIIYKMVVAIVRLSYSIIKLTIKLSRVIITSLFHLARSIVSIFQSLFGKVMKFAFAAFAAFATFSSITSMIRSYSPARAKQIEVAFGQLRATIGEILAPLAPMIRNMIINIAKFIKQGASKIDIKTAFKWLVFFMFFTVGVIIAVVKLVIRIVERIRSLFHSSGEGVASFVESLWKKILELVATVGKRILELLRAFVPRVIGFLQGFIPKLIASLGPMVQQAAEMLGPLIKEGLDLLVQALSWIVRNLPSWLMIALKYLIQAFRWIVKQLPGWLKTLGEILIHLAQELLLGIRDAIVEYWPEVRDELIGLLEDLWEVVKKAFWDFIYSVPEMFSNLGSMIWRAIKSALPSWAKSLLGIEDSGETSDTGQGDFSGSTGAGGSFGDSSDSTKLEGLDKGKDTEGFMSKLGTPEGAMRGVAEFFKELGLEDVGEVFSDMANLFEGLFKDTGNLGLAFEAKEAKSTTLEDIGKQARQAALGANKKPEEVTAEATEETARNTSVIGENMQGLVSALSGGGLARLAQEAEANARAIQILNRTNKQGVEAGKQEQMVIITGIDAMTQRQELTNELLMRITNSQKLVADIERSKNYSFSRLSSQGQ